ncbi:MAG TPA: HAD family hydrolase [Candidatus Acidoferrales bacterium]|nr:HAD family hydrolase [Candidatus Acidoferrales bacterium]
MSHSAAKSPPRRLIIFDVDGVLVDTRGSFQQTTLETVEFFTGRRVTRTELHRWKNRPGFNDDWKLSHEWVRALGGDFEFEEVKRKFQEIYWGKNGKGNVSQEKWLLPRGTLRRLQRIADLAIFTGRVWREMDYTLDRARVREFFDPILTVEEVARPKPDPEGLLRILGGRPASLALYVGDNVDDALAAKCAEMRFVGVLPRNSQERRQKGSQLRKLGAESILGEISELEAWLERAWKTRGAPGTSFPSEG